MSRRKRATGFSLVELLLAISLMSMLLALAYGGLRASSQATEKGQKILDESNRIRMAHMFVRRQLTQMLPLAFEQDLEDQQQRTVFIGEQNRIRYVAQMPGYLGYGGPQVQELEIVPGADGLEMVLSHALLQGFEESFLYEREPVLLLDKVESASFSFLGIDENGEMSNWVTSWDNPSTLPLAVALEIELTEDTYLQWPELTTTVRIDSSALSAVNGNVQDKPALDTAIRDLIYKRKIKQ
jgi:general secretion pathway protein J